MATLRRSIPVLLLIACSDDAMPGDACEDGGACEDDQACVIEASGTAGECATLPDDCAAFPSCEDACFETFPEICAGEYTCSSTSGRITVTCL